MRERLLVVDDDPGLLLAVSDTLREEGYDVRSEEITVRNRDGEPCRVALYSLHSAQRTLLPTHPGRGVMAA